jgi:hypothetical protein
MSASRVHLGLLVSGTGSRILIIAVEIPQQYPYRGRDPVILFTGAFFGVGAFVLARQAELRTAGEVIPLWIMSVLCWLFALIVLHPFIWWFGVSVPTLQLGPEAVVFPSGFLHRKRRAIRYDDIRAVFEQKNQGQTILLVYGPTGAASKIIASLLPDKESYIALKEFLTEKAKSNRPRMEKLKAERMSNHIARLRAEMTKPIADAPVFELFVGDNKLAHLHEPKWEEMFWCLYRIVPLSDAADRILHDETTWKEVKFTVIRAKDGTPNPHTFTAGDFVIFCKRDTDRLSFRSLWPPKT